MAIKRALCCGVNRTSSESAFESEEPRTVVDGPQSLWFHDKEQVLQDVRDGRAALLDLKKELVHAMGLLDGHLNKPSSRVVIDFNVNSVLLDLDALVVRLEQLVGVFDAWFRYQKLASMQVSMVGVQTVLRDFEELTDVLTQNKSRCDILDSLEQYGDFNGDVTIFHLHLVNLDERLWLQLEHAVGGSVGNADASAPAVRPLSTSDALALMIKFDSVSSRNDAAAMQHREHSRSFHESESHVTVEGNASESVAPKAENLMLDNSAWNGIEKLYFSVLRRLLDSIREIQSDYTLHKDNPPQVRNTSPVIQHILWAQQLQRRVQNTIVDCRSMPPFLHSAPLYRKVSRIAAKTEETLSEYLSCWYSAWVETVEITKSGLNATLLVEHPELLRLCVNYDFGINTLIKDTKGFLRAGYPVPFAAQKVLNRELELKTYYAALTEGNLYMCTFIFVCTCVHNYINTCQKKKHA